MKAAEKRGDVVEAPNDVDEVNDTQLSSKVERDEQGYLDGQRKKGVLRKLNLHKV